MRRNQLLIFNLVGLIIYLRSASLIWAPRGDEALDGGPGDPIIWVVYAFPSVFICTCVNIIALPIMGCRAIMQRRWGPPAQLVVVMLLWATAFEYDSSRHYKGDVVPAIGPLGAMR